MRAVVIGGGVAGMSAAILLAQQGHAVTMLEKAPKLAPLIRGFTRNGLRFDTGFHYAGGLLPGGILDAWLQALGVSVRPVPQRPDCCELFRFRQNGGREVALPWGRQRLLEGLGGQFPGHQAELTKIIDEMTSALERSPYTSPANQDNSPPFLAGETLSVKARLDATNLPEVLKLVLAARCLLYGALPHLAAWHEFCAVAAPFCQSAHGLAGGGHGLAEAFSTAVDQAGVTVACQTTAQQIVLDGQRRVRGVALADGCGLDCDWCFYTGHPKSLESLLGPEALRPAYYRRISGLSESPHGLMLFGQTTSDFLDGRVLYLCPSQDLDEMANTRGLADQFVSLLTGEPDGQGRRPLVAITPLDPGETQPWQNSHPRPAAYQAYKARRLEGLADRILADCPEVGQDFAVLGGATDLTMRRWVQGSTGSLFGIRHGLDQTPPLPVTKVGGLFLAGQNIILPGVLGAMVSAAVAVGFAVGHAPILERFRQCAARP